MVAGCVSGVGAALQSRMADQATAKRKKHNWMNRGEGLDRALRVLTFYVCIAMIVAVLTLILGLLLSAWDTQTPFVAGAMTASGLAFLLAGGLSVALWVPRQNM